MKIFNNYNKTLLSTLEQNKVNGLDAERFCSAMATIALNSRISWAARTEDNSKVDLIATYIHPWKKNKVDTILVQVKSGLTFAETYRNSNNQISLKIKNRFDVYLNSNHNQLICWVDRDKHEIFWFIIKLNSRFYRTDYGMTHRLSPATRYDLTRILVSINSKDGGKGIIFKSLEDNHSNYRNLRNRAKIKYSQLNKSKLISPILGEIEFTKFGWRHMTRESRLAKYKFASMEIFPVLDKIIKRTPTKHYIQNQKENEYKEKIIREVEYLLEYDHAKNTKNNSVRVYVKIVEFIEYPTNWHKNSILCQSIRRRVIFKSIYYKK